MSLSNAEPGTVVVDDLCVAHGRTQVVHDVSLVLRPGTITGLIGPNGSGKSTLLRAVAGLQLARSGSVTLDGRDLLAASSTERARRIAMLTQQRPTPSGLTVREVVELGRAPHRSRWLGRDTEGAAAVARALALTSLDDLTERSVEHLSGGQRQRVWLASCLAQRADVLLLDEPTTYLDLRHQVDLLDLVADLAAEERLAVGVVLHDLNQAAALADDLVLLADGRVRAHGRPADVLRADLLTEHYGIAVDVEPQNCGWPLVTARGRHNTARAAA